MCCAKRYPVNYTGVWVTGTQGAHFTNSHQVEHNLTGRTVQIYIYMYISVYICSVHIYTLSTAFPSNSFNRVDRKVLYYCSLANNPSTKNTLQTWATKTAINKSSQIIWLAARKRAKKGDKENAPLAVCHQIKAATFPPFSTHPPFSAEDASLTISFSFLSLSLYLLTAFFYFLCCHAKRLR